MVRDGIRCDPHAEYDEQRHRDEADIVQAFHPDERDGDVKYAGNDGHQHIVQMVSRTYQVAGDACLHGVPAEQQRGKEAG